MSTSIPPNHPITTYRLQDGNGSHDYYTTISVTSSGDIVVYGKCYALDLLHQRDIADNIYSGDGPQMSPELIGLLRDIVQKVEETRKLKKALSQCNPKSTREQKRHAEHIGKLLAAEVDALAVDQQQLKAFFQRKNSAEEGVDSGGRNSGMRVKAKKVRWDETKHRALDDEDERDGWVDLGAFSGDIPFN